jgi:hypothetical protein
VGKQDQQPGSVKTHKTLGFLGYWPDFAMLIVCIVVVQGGLDPNMSTHEGVRFRHYVRVLYNPNKQRAPKPRMLLS